MPRRAVVALGPPAAAVVAAALRVSHHHVVLGLAADQTLVHVEEAHVLVSGGAIWKNKDEGERHFGRFGESRHWRIRPHEGEGRQG